MKHATILPPILLLAPMTALGYEDDSESLKAYASQECSDQYFGGLSAPFHQVGAGLEVPFSSITSVTAWGEDSLPIHCLPRKPKYLRDRHVPQYGHVQTMQSSKQERILQ